MSGLRLAALWVVLCACRAPASEPEASDLEGLTTRLVELDRDYWAAGQDADIAKDLVEIATRRAPLWEAAARTEPRRALKNVVPREIAIALPPAATELVEQRFERRGSVTSLVADDFVNHVATYDLRFDDGVELLLAPGVARPRHGERFGVTGYRLGDAVLVESGERDAALAGIQWASNEKVLAVMLSFSNKSLTISSSTLTSALSASSSYFSTISNGTMVFTSTVVGTYTSETAATCSFSTIEAATYRALAVAGVDTHGYNQIVAVVPSNSCGYTGQSQVGQVATGRSTFSIINDTSALTHELGHAHGLYHAHSLSCVGSDLADDESTCIYSDYGHPTDLMASQGGSIDAFGLEVLGYLGRTGFGTATTVTTSGTHTLYPLTGTYTNTRLLKIPYEKDATTGWTRSFYVEYHVATGLDAYLSATNMNQKVFVTLSTEGDDNSGLFLKAIGAGESFTAPNGTVISVSSVSAASASVAVTMPTPSGTCVRATPSILILEQAIETPNTAGSTTQYKMQLWNKDSADCGPSKFAISSADLPSGWSLSASDIVAYGGAATGSGLVYVTSAASATGTNTFTVTATDSSVANHSKSATATYVVSTCAPIAPTVTLSPTSGMTVAAGSTANYLLSFTNNNDAACGNTSVSMVTGLAPSGWSVAPETQAFTVAAGATSTQQVTVTAPASATGTNTIGAYLRYFVNAHNYFTSTTKTTATVGSTCVHTPPKVTISPTSQTSLAQTELTYTVTVKNIDGPNCAATAPNAITLSVTPPSGITASLDSTSMSLAQGASSTTTLRMTPTTTTPGDYQATVTANLSGVTSSAKATYKLSCGTISAPTVSMTPSTQQGQPGGTLSYGITVTNPNTSTLCGSRTYTLDSTVTNLNGTTGWTASTAATTMTLASGASQSTTMSVTSPLDAKAPWAVYRPTVTVTDDVGNSTVKAAFYSIQCETNPPSVSLSPSSTTVKPGTAVPITVTILDNDTLNCEWTMTLGDSRPSGWTETTLPDEITLSGGDTTTVTWTPTVPAGYADGTYSPKVTVYNAEVATTATASVTVDCGRVAPSVTLTPSSQSSAAGGALSYSATIKNNDDASCANQTFSLATSLPSGWTGSVGTSSVTLAPGASSTTTLSATSPLTATGANSVGVTATGTKSGATTGTATYNVNCTTAKPSVSLSPSTQTGAATAALGYTATIVNNNTGCSAEAITIAPSVPSGWGGAVSSTMVTLASQASTTVTLTATSTAAATGTNTVGVVATSVAGSTTGTASYVVACTRAAPTVALSPTTQTAAPGVATTYTATITNNDVGCATNTFSLGASVPAGWTGTPSSASVVLAAGASTTATLGVTAPASASSTNQVSLVVNHAVSGTGIGTADFVVTCTRAAPTVSLGADQSGAAGATLTYTATVTNNDSGCAAGTFTLDDIVPTGWTGSLASSVTLAAGAATNTTFSVTSAADATGANTVSVSASNGTSGSGSDSALFTIAVPCTRAAPTVSLTPSSRTGTQGSAQTYTVTVTNNDSASCSSETFTLARTLPAMPPGWAGTFSPASLSLAAGAASTSTLTVTAPAMVMQGSYAFSVSASNGSSGTGSTTGTFVVALCTRAAPTVSVSPSSQSGTPGTALGYTVTVTNNDSAACASGSFTLGSTLLSGWSGSYSAGSLTLAAGASGTSTWTVTSAGNATAGTQTITATATNASSGTGSGSASYVVAAPCVRAAPSVALAPSSQSALAGTGLAYTVTITNNDSASCGSGTFTLGNAMAVNWTGSYPASTVTLAPAASTSVTLTVTSPANATPGSQTFSASASNAASGSGSAMGTYVVLAPCTRASPSVTVSPSSQSGSPGSALAYTVTVTNNDSATCANGTFTLASSLPVSPAGWTAMYSATELTLAPGASSTASATITSPAAAPITSYTFSISATSAASGVGSANATYAVVAACVRAAPAVTITPSTQSATAGTLLTYTATITNQDTGCSSSTFTVAADAAGWTASTSSSSVTLGSGASTTVTLSVTSAANASTGNYLATVTASSAASGTGSGQATYTVVPSCVRAAPTVELAPATQSSSAGGTLSYTATITNKDSACGTSTFTVAATGPNGWTVGAGPSSVALASGASTILTISATSPIGTSAGTSTVTVTATSAASGTGTGTASYVVAASCTRAAPTVSVSPSSHSANQGGSAVYTVTVTNNDNGCSPGSFELDATLPSGWSSTYAADPITVAAGASASVSWTVRAAAAATLGATTITATATSTGSGTGSGTATFNVTSACVTALPTLSIAPASQSAAAGTALVYTATLTNNDTNCASQTFAISHSAPTGFSGALGTTSVALAAGASTTVQYTLTSQLTAPLGNATLQLTATGASGTATATAVATITTTCVRVAPSVTITPATQTAAAGAPLVYSALVANHDVACPPSQFAIAAAAPIGWTSTLSQATALLAPGSSATVSVTVTSPASAIGSHMFSVTAGSGVSGTGAASGTYQVACNHAPPALGLSPATQTGASGTALTYMLTIANTSTSCGDETFALAAVVPTDWLAELDVESVTLPPSGAVAVAIVVTSPDDARAGDHAFEVTVTGGQSAAAAASYTVTASGGGDGCNTGRSPSLWLVLVLVLLCRRRR